MSWGSNDAAQLGHKDQPRGLGITGVWGMEDKHVSVIAAGEHHGAAGLEKKSVLSN
jgi:hypothetical protein